MKKQLFLLFLFTMLINNLDAQFWYNKYYPSKNMSELSSDELFFLSQKASHTTVTGIVLSVAGGGIAFMGTIILLTSTVNNLATWHYSGDKYYNTVAVVIIAGAVTALIGVPIMIIGISRKREIENMINYPKPKAFLQLSPSFQCNYVLSSFSSGLTISLRF